jgi:hypothetical protein
VYEECIGIGYVACGAEIRSERFAKIKDNFCGIVEIVSVVTGCVGIAIEVAEDKETAFCSEGAGVVEETRVGSG